MTDFITLNDLFNKNIEELPDFVKIKYVIYCCENIVNHKKYIGQTRMRLYDRWSGSSSMSHKTLFYNYSSDKNRSVLQAALHKYGIDNFIIYILEKNINSKEELLLAEIKWIKNLNTCTLDKDCNGYNMTRGGETVDHMDTPEAHRKSIETNRKTHNGRLAYNTPEAHAKGIITDRLKHGGILHINLPEVRKKAYMTNKLRHNNKLAFSSEESLRKGRETQYKRYGCLGFNQPGVCEKAIASQKAHYNGKLAMNLPEAAAKARINAPLMRMINNIDRHIIFLKEQNIEINAYNYVNLSADKKRMWQQHIPNVLNKLDELRKFKEWTDEMELIFSHISYDISKKGINKIVFN